jgi:3-oxoacyl-[acyl-carrier protein] reductase
MTTNREFAGKVAIVTGAASGISRVIASRFAADGAGVTLADIDDRGGPVVADELARAGHDVLFVKTDVRESASVNAMVEQTVERFGRVDILVHGAGVGVHRHIVDLSDEEWDLQVDVQLRGAFLLSRAVGRKLIAQGQGGRIILIGSTSGNNARPNSGPHAASKAGEIQMMRVLAQELGPHQITANVVSPGLTDIAAISKTAPPVEYQRIFVHQVPLGRLATPDEIADAVLFFASDRARFVTGQVLCVDGGYSAGKLSVARPNPEDYVAE